jgi:hypothetical protein
VSKRPKKDSPHSASTAVRSPLGQFEPGGSRSPVEDPKEYESLIREVADPEQREFLEEASRFATTWQYLSSAVMQLPPEIAAEVANLKDRSLSVRERITRMRDVNQRLMEFIDKHDRKNASVRQ